MPRYEFSRDQRNSGGPRLSVVITAYNHDEASGIFEERWQQKLHEHQTTKQIQAEAMTPAALEVKRNTKGIKG